MRRRRRRKKSKARGRAAFTLIELVLVALLVAVIVGLSSPLFRNTFSGIQLKNTADNLAAMIGYAQEMSIIEKVPYKIIFSFKDGKYWLTKRVETVEGMVYKPIPGKYGRVFRAPDGILFQGEREFQDKSEALLFYPDGKSSEGIIRVVSRKHQGYQGYTVKAKGFGEHVEVQEIAP